MLLFYLNNKNVQQSRIIRNLFRSYTGEKQIQNTSRFFENQVLNNKAKVIIFAGILRGEGLIYRHCREKDKKFLYVDHAYLNRGYNANSSHTEWMRITPSAFNWSLNSVEDDERWNQYFSSKYQLSSWNKHDGKKILVLPPSEATKSLFPESVEWTNNAIDEISKITTSPIHIREKPEQPIVDFNTNQVIDRKFFTHEKTIEEEMLEAKLIVTFNSAVPVTGTILGIPCYCSPYAAAYPMNINLNYLNNPPEPNRQAWLNQLVYHQYTGEEMKNGKVWDLLKKYY